MADRLIVGRGRCQDCDSEIHLVFASVGCGWVHEYRGCELCQGYFLLDDVVEVLEGADPRVRYQAGEDTESPIWRYQPGTRVALGGDFHPAHAPELMIDEIVRRRANP